MEQEISLSLVIPTFNRASLIEQTIKAALDQSVPFSEIIVVNDGSTDNTVEVLDKYRDNIRTIHIENQGVQVARNVGVRSALTSHVTLCDSDDLLDLKYVSTLLTWLNQVSTSKIIYSNFHTFDDHSIYPDKFSLAPSDFFSGAKSVNGFLVDIPDLYVRTLQFQPLFCSGVTIERDFFTKIGGFNPELKGIGSEDWEFTLRAIAATTAALCMTPLVRVRKHASNDSANSTRQAVGEALVLEFALSHHFKAKEYQSRILQEIEHIRYVAFERAFAGANFDLACNMAHLLSHTPKSTRFWAKRLITLLPSPFRMAMWKMTKQ